MNDVRVVAAGNQILAVDRLTIGAGEEVAIVGPSGAGKSSLVALLLGWHRPAAGEVRVGGAPLDAARLEALRRRTVWVDPSVYLWNRPLDENLTFGLLTPPADLGPALADAALDDVIARLPDGVATPLGEAGALVSGGEGQRVRFGRGLTREPPALVILDEPFRGLAREQRQALLTRARARWAGATFICVTHDVGETASFPRVLVIADGTRGGGRRARGAAGPPRQPLRRPAGGRGAGAHGGLVGGGVAAPAARGGSDRRGDRRVTRVTDEPQVAITDCLWPLAQREALTAAGRRRGGAGPAGARGAVRAVVRRRDPDAGGAGARRGAGGVAARRGGRRL